MAHGNSSFFSKNPYLGPQLLLTSLFFIWGFITCLNDILIPHLKALFTLSYAQAMLVQFCFFAAYFIVSLPSGYLVEKLGYQTGIVIGLCIAGSGCLLFYPAAAERSYGLFLSAFFVLAAGITLLQVAANPYVTILGRPESASSRLTITQAFNSLGTTVAPYFGSIFILSAGLKTAEELRALSGTELTTYQSLQAAAVQTPYLGIAATLFSLAIIFYCIRLPQISAPSAKAVDSSSTVHNASAWSYRHLRLGAMAIFLYVGAEVTIGSFLISFLSQPAVTGLPAETVGRYVAYYWGGAMLGRFIGALLMQKMPAYRLLSFNALMAVVLISATILSHGYPAMWLILSVGLFNSIMFPTIFSLALKDLGPHTGQGSGILCAAIVGGAILPIVQGLFADHFSLTTSFFVPLVCYLYIAYYGWRGHLIVNY